MKFIGLFEATTTKLVHGQSLPRKSLTVPNSSDIPEISLCVIYR